MTAPRRVARARRPLPLLLRTPGLADAARPFVEARALDPRHLRLLDAVAPRFGEARVDVLVALACVLEAEGRGHTALDLSQARARLGAREEAPVEAEPDDDALAARETPPGGTEDPDDTGDVVSEPEEAPDAAAPPPLGDAEWARILGALPAVQASPLVGGPDTGGRPFALLPPRPGEPAPLLMTRRFLDEQRRVARRLVDLARSQVPASAAISAEDVAAWTRRLYPTAPEGQGAKALARMLDGRRLAIVTGGPGTGKTLSLARALAALFGVHRALGRPAPRVALAAPTGKAAVRMTEAIAEAATEVVPERRLDVEEAVREALRALPSFTIQKLLRMRPGTGVPAHGPDAPLPYDVVVVDEASMLDVALMRKLVEAIGPNARLLLLGDRDQLASVDAGTVLADVVAGFFAGAHDDLSARVVFFEESHRFREAPLVGRFASLVQTRPSDPDPARRRAEAAALLTGAVRIEVPEAPAGTLVADWHDVPDVPWLDEEVVERLAEPFLRGYAPRAAATFAGGGTDDGETHALLEALEAYRVLCTHRSGPRGVAGLNRGIGQRVRAHLDAAWKERRGRGDLPARGGFWIGLPVLVTENAYGVDLRNGDVGLVVRRGRDLEVAFLRARGSARYPDGVQRVPIGRMPPWAPAFALTIHKGQGSQYAHVAVVLAGRDSPIETRELVYTGITRAKRCVTWVGSAAALSRALGRPVNRMSALGRCLGEALGG